MTGHTPGPWECYHDDGREEYKIGHERDVPVGIRHIATVSLGYDEPVETEQHANAHLISAAPEMYGLCKELLDWIHGKRTGRCLTADMTQRLSVTIAKAEG